jgi:hypothetical protein
VLVSAPVSVNVVVKAVATGTVLLSAEVTADQTDPDLTNNEGVVSVRIKKKDDKNIFGCTLSQGVFDPSLLLLLILSLLHLTRRTLRESAVRQ